MIARRLVIRGVVQGVFFRESMVQAARAEDVVGWVRNRRDGSVEAWLQGATGAVERVIEWTRRGPPRAEVLAVEVEARELDATLYVFMRVASA